MSITQKMSITPRLQQALKVLSMPLQELTQFIAQKLEQNPVLELAEEETAVLRGRYFTDPTTTLTPDVEIQYLNGKYQAISVDGYIPRLQINPYYLDMMRNHQSTLDSETKEWIEKRYRDAANLLSSLAQRGSTIARVAEVIFEIQTEFLTRGVKGIKPLTLRTIAEKLGIHESTVSRVTSNKYVQTPHGMYPLRFFFSNETQKETGTAPVEPEISDTEEKPDTSTDEDGATPEENRTDTDTGDPDDADTDAETEETENN